MPSVKSEHCENSPSENSRGQASFPGRTDETGKGTNMVSPRKLAANRNNARFSTGPKTSRGKQNASHNAIKHGLLAKSYFANEEEEAMFAEVWEGCRDYYQPVGLPEEILVKDIAFSYLQEIRGQRYEAGEIRKQILEAFVRPQPEPVFHDAQTDVFLALGTPTRRSFSGSREVGYVLKVLEEIRTDLGTQNSLSPTLMNRVSQYLGEDWKDLDDKETILEKVQQERENLQQLKAKMEDYESSARKAQRDALAAPSPVAMSSILRYSSANQNRRYRAMAQLERMQRQRLGEPIPPPLKVNLN